MGETTILGIIFRYNQAVVDGKTSSVEFHKDMSSLNGVLQIGEPKAILREQDRIKLILDDLEN